MLAALASRGRLELLSSVEGHMSRIDGSIVSFSLGGLCSYIPTSVTLFVRSSGKISKYVTITEMGPLVRWT